MSGDRLGRASRGMHCVDGHGFEYLVGEASRGKSLLSISEFFSISPEFQLRYGSRVYSSGVSRRAGA